MTAGCWWAFIYRREGFIPQMFGSIRTLCAATSNLHEFPAEGIHWGDYKFSRPSYMHNSADSDFSKVTKEVSAKGWLHAGLSAGAVGNITPNELYA